ncbi:hypothetical protein MVES1_002076 [Malassezia vespertilionis]|uniref:AB hydrolase-1 domain-containing protein n=1 Tax=Malassezia vespertilionis TaxID=2020962 RepID=A0A2N1JC41_9BASI|nr:uncharacterized protein MVES1_002076 [Malassezia vespertilionis]PKI84114.1 hypothetical protein MVES_001963 [Malassezia vespertilionis]WFD06722.1 hypothetical protein MVES1_002076 [Malassezia vespertilionis]
MTTPITHPPNGAAHKAATAESLEKARAESGNAYLPTVFNPATIVSKGPLRVAKDRVVAAKSPDGEPGFNLYYEQHGTGPNRIIFLMGLNNSCFGWLSQVEEFGADPNYSVVVMDNRGYGNSDAPSTRYKTTDFALDVFEVLDHIGWTEERSVNLAGVSMGGMMALEVARMQPKRFKSLLLLSTTSGHSFNLPPIRGLGAISQGMMQAILGIATPERRVDKMIELLFPEDWLNAPSASDATGKRTNGEVTKETFYWRIAFTRRPKLQGAMSQIMAALTHNVSDEHLKHIDENIPRVRIITGDWDNLVRPSNSAHMAKVMSHADYQVWPGGGHALHVQYPERFNKMLREFTQ